MTTVFFDRTCGKKLPQALRLLGLAVEGHADHFADDVHEDVWLAAVGERGWFVVTNDKNIRRNEAVLQALISYGVGCFVLGGGSRTKVAPGRHPSSSLGSHGRNDGDVSEAVHRSN